MKKRETSPRTAGPRDRDLRAPLTPLWKRSAPGAALRRDQDAGRLVRVVVCRLLPAQGAPRNPLSSARRATQASTSQTALPQASEGQARPHAVRNIPSLAACGAASSFCTPPLPRRTGRRPHVHGVSNVLIYTTYDTTVYIT